MTTIVQKSAAMAGRFGEDGMASAPAAVRSSFRTRSFVDAEQPALLQALRRCSLESEHIRWESLRGTLGRMGYSVVLERGLEHLLPFSG
jgi:hypothetical protein